MTPALGKLGEDGRICDIHAVGGDDEQWVGVSFPAAFPAVSVRPAGAFGFHQHLIILGKFIKPLIHRANQAKDKRRQDAGQQPALPAFISKQQRAEKIRRPRSRQIARASPPSNRHPKFVSRKKAASQTRATAAARAIWSPASGNFWRRPESRQRRPAARKSTAPNASARRHSKNPRTKPAGRCFGRG